MKRLLCLGLLLAVLLAGCITSQPATDTDPTAGETLKIHYIDVGQADCILLECAGRFMLIDGGNVADSSLVVSYLQNQGVQDLSLVVCTHAHEDHVGGLAGVLAVFPTAQVWSPTRTYDSKAFNDFLYYADQQELAVTIPQPGDQFDLAKASVTVLGPVEQYADANNTSIVLLVEFGATRFLFTGDMELQAETDMLDYWGEHHNWDVDVLKMGHHGSETSSGYRFLYETDPEHAVISVGKDNSYGHPHEAPMSRLHDAGITAYRTDQLGTVVIASDGKDLTFSWEKASGKPVDPTGSAAAYYIGNVNSKVLHAPDCESLPAQKNQVRFDRYQDAIEAGYTPCSHCLG